MMGVGDVVRLEIGPGYAKGKNEGYRFNPHFHPKDPDVVYLDIRRPEFRCGIPWIVADAHNLPLRDGVVDEIFAGHVIEHLEDPLKFLGECRRVLKKGSMVTVVTPNFLSRNAYLDPTHKHIFNFVKVWRLVGAAGLKPHLPNPNIGNLIPWGIRILFKLFLAFLSDSIIVVGEKI